MNWHLSLQRYKWWNCTWNYTISKYKNIKFLWYNCLVSMQTVNTKV